MEGTLQKGQVISLSVWLQYFLNVPGDHWDQDNVPTPSATHAMVTDFPVIAN